MRQYPQISLNNGFIGFRISQSCLTLVFHAVSNPITLADASEIGYGAIIYLRMTNDQGELHVCFVIGKAGLLP